MTLTSEGYLLSTGKIFKPYAGIIGLAPDGELFEGYDGYLSESIKGPYEDFTKEEYQEIADHMIAAWQAFRSTL